MFYIIVYDCNVHLNFFVSEIYQMMRAIWAEKARLAHVTAQTAEKPDLIFLLS